MQQHHSMKLRGEKKVHNSEGPFPCILRIAAVREGGERPTNLKGPLFRSLPFPYHCLFSGEGEEHAS